MDVNATLSTVISIFLLLLLGYGAKKTGIMSQKDSPVITSLVINLTMPAFIFTAIYGKPINSDMVKAPFLFFAAEMVVLGVAYALARALRLDRKTTGAFLLVAAFGNTGFMGYPIISAAFGNNNAAMPATVIMDGFAMMTVLSTVGVAIAACFAGSRFEWRSMLEFLKTPLIPSTVLALALHNVYFPPFILSTLGYLGAATVPLAMISVGLGLSTRHMRQYPAALTAAIVLKMAILPAIVLVAMRLSGISGTVSHVGILLGTMPAAVFAGVISTRYGTNGTFAASAIALGTLLSVVWVPVVLMLLH